MQPAELLVEIGKPGRDAGKPAVALVGRVGHVHRVGHRLEERLEALARLAGLAQLVKRLFGLDDLFLGLALHLDAGRLGRDVAPKSDQRTPDRKIVDHLRIVARGEGRDRGPREPREIRRTAQLLQTGIVLEKRLERHRRGQRVLGDARGRHLVDACVHRVEEMAFVDDGRDPVVDLVVRQDRAQKLLLGLDVVRQRVDAAIVLSAFADCPDLVHACPCLLVGIPTLRRARGKQGNLGGSLPG